MSLSANQWLHTRFLFMSSPACVMLATALLLFPLLMKTVPDIIIHCPSPGKKRIDDLAMMAACFGKMRARYRMSTKLSG